MDKNELRQICVRYFMPANIEVWIELLEIYSDFFVTAIRIHQPEETTPRRDAEAKIVFQMMWTKLMHLKAMLSGISYKKNEVVINNIIDPTLVATLTRNVYETAGMFNVVFRTPSTDDERMILYNLWVCSGLNYRQRFVEITKLEENLQKGIGEKARIDQLVAEIKHTNLFKLLDERQRKKIETRLTEREYLIRIDNNKISCLNWHDVAKNMGLEKFSALMYTHFCLNAHPSNVSVFQFGDMFSEPERGFVALVKFNLTYLAAFMSAFIADYLATYPNVLSTFNNQPLINQIVINFHQQFARGEAYAINNAADALN